MDENEFKIIMIYGTLYCGECSNKDINHLLVDHGDYLECINNECISYGRKRKPIVFETGEYKE